MVGQTLGHYSIVEKLGAGGMGEVYRARDSQLGRDVAIKVLPAAFAGDSDRLARFEQEARLLAALNHPNIATIHGLERADGRRYLVLEFVAGKTLAEQTAEGPLPLEEVLKISRQIAEALEAAHERGIIHRDLKPANIKITPQGKVKVLDFGLAKAFAPDGAADPSKSPTITHHAASDGVILGTAAYMSPEQARGRPLDKRTDIWSYGCVVYELLTSRQAFPGETISDTLAAILKSEPDWSALPPETPANIRLLLRRCLEKDPTRRLHDIADARIEIEDALSGAAPAGATVSAAALAAAPIWRRALPWTLAGICALAALFAFWQWQRAARRPQAATRRFSVVTNFSGVEAQPSLSPDGRSVAFVSDRDGQIDIWVGLVVGGSLVRITNDRNIEARPRWSPDGAKIAYGRLNEDGLWDIWMVPAFGGTPRKILANARDPAWSPDGQSLAYANLSNNTIWMCDAGGGNPRQVTQPELQAVHREPAYSHDARQLAFVRRRGFGGPFGELATLEFATGKVRHLTDDGGLLISPAWSPDGEYIYFASSRGGATNIWRISQGGGMPEQVTAGQGDDAEPDVSADGKRIVFSTYRMNANLAELTLDAKDATKLKWLTSDSARMEVAPAYSPDGKRIAYFTARRGAEGEFIWVMNANGSEPVQIFGEERGSSIFPRWSRDGQRLLFSFRARRGFEAGEIRRVGLEGGMPEKLGVMDARDNFGGVGPGDRYAYLGTDGETHIFDPASKQDQKLQGIRGTVPRWSPDGRAIAYIVSARRQGDAEAGLWLYEFGRPPRQVYRGWVSWYGWAGPDEFLLVEGKPDLKAVLWRVRRDGTLPVRILSVRMHYPYYAWIPTMRFDIHPDGKRIAIEALELREADIGMIEETR